MESIKAGEDIYYKLEIESPCKINISFIIPPDIKDNDNFNVSYHGYISEPSDDDIIEEQDFTDIELSDNLQNETTGKNLFVYLEQVTKGISCAVIKFSSNTNLNTVGIVVNLFNIKDIYEIYESKYSEYLDIDIPKVVQKTTFFLYTL